MISFIIPAHNEAFEVGRTLQSVFAAARSEEEPFEVIVVNDASTDATAALARAAGARVIDVDLRKISAVRNAGAALRLADAQRADGTGPGGHCGATQESSAADLHPHVDSSDQPLPGPARKTLRPTG